MARHNTIWLQSPNGTRNRWRVVRKRMAGYYAQADLEKRVIYLDTSKKHYLDVIGHMFHEVHHCGFEDHERECTHYNSPANRAEYNALAVFEWALQKFKDEILESLED